MGKAWIERDQLPRVYRPRPHPSVAELMDGAAALAAAGEAEGALLVADRPGALALADGRLWTTRHGDLALALIFRPDLDAATVAQLMPVSAAALAQTLATHTSPLTSLHWRWPDTVLLNDAPVAVVSLQAPRPLPARLPWLVVGVAVNLSPLPEGEALDLASMVGDGGFEGDAPTLLIEFCRQLLRTVTRWQDRGLIGALGPWAQLLRPPAEAAGARVALDAAGNLEVEGARELGLAERLFGATDPR